LIEGESFRMREVKTRGNLPAKVRQYPDRPEEAPAN
jgi:hypothetical protein